MTSIPPEKTLPEGSPDTATDASKTKVEQTEPETKVDEAAQEDAAKVREESGGYD